MGENVVAGQGGEQSPLPAIVDGAQELSRFVRYLVEQGYRTWPLAPEIRTKFMEPVLEDKVWLVGEPALKRNLYLCLMGLIVEAFPSHFKTLLSGKRNRREGVRGLMQMLKPLPIEAIMELLVHFKFYKKVEAN